MLSMLFVCKDGKAGEDVTACYSPRIAVRTIAVEVRTSKYQTCARYCAQYEISLGGIFNLERD